MFEVWQTMFSFNFIVRAIVIGGAVSLCASLLGVSLVLKRYSMIGDGLSHVAFGTMSIALVMNVAPLQFSVPIVVLAAFFLLRISQNSRINGDAAIALISSTAIAIGITVTSLSSGLNADVSSYLFGSVLALTPADVRISLSLSLVVFLLFILFYDQIFAITFDENFAKATGVRVDLYNMLIAFLTAVTIVLGMRIMGTMLISSLIIFPALSAMRLFHSFKKVIIAAALISVLCFFFGVTASFVWSIPAGAAVVLVNGTLFLVFSLLALIQKKV